ncbi:MAG: tetratricopeptide repeat protein [Phycisphaerales bacterium]|nr:MAG: tetratricopeptide repeat protein [Phycisphaerales bacterium]
MMATLEGIMEHIRTGRFEEAREALDSAETTDTNRAELLFLRGYLQEMMFDRAGALETYQRVLEDEPDHTEAMFRAALLCDQGGDDETAIDLYEKCTAENPAHVNALINLASLCEERGQLVEAEQYLKYVLAEHPNHRRAMHFLKSVQASYTMVFDEKTQRDREQHNADLEVSVNDFELSVRSRNCLRQMNIRTLGDLLRTTEAELLSYKNFGETSLNEIKAMLTQKGLELGQELQRPQPLPRPTAPPVAGEASASVHRSVAELELSVRARKCLQLLGITTLGELVARSEAELMATKNFGQTSLNEIRRQLAQFGMSLRD